MFEERILSNRDTFLKERELMLGIKRLSLHKTKKMFDRKLQKFHRARQIDK